MMQYAAKKAHQRVATDVSTMMQEQNSILFDVSGRVAMRHICCSQYMLVSLLVRAAYCKPAFNTQHLILCFISFSAHQNILQNTMKQLAEVKATTVCVSRTGSKQSSC